MSRWTAAWIFSPHLSGSWKPPTKQKKATSMSRYIPCLAFNSHSCWGNLWRDDFPSQGLIATPFQHLLTSSTWPHYPRTWLRVKTSRCWSNTHKWSGVGTLSNSLVVLHPSWFTWVHAGCAMPASFWKKFHQSNLFAWLQALWWKVSPPVPCCDAVCAGPICKNKGCE